MLAGRSTLAVVTAVNPTDRFVVSSTTWRAPRKFFVQARSGETGAHFRLGKVHMQKRSWLKAYSAFKRGWHLDTSNEELTRACQEAHKAMTGLDKVEQQLQNSNTKKPMSNELASMLTSVFVPQ